MTTLHPAMSPRCVSEALVNIQGKNRVTEKTTFDAASVFAVGALHDRTVVFPSVSVCEDIRIFGLSVCHGHLEERISEPRPELADFAVVQPARVDTDARPQLVWCCMRIRLYGLSVKGRSGEKKQKNIKLTFTTRPMGMDSGVGDTYKFLLSCSRRGSFTPAG